MEILILAALLGLIPAAIASKKGRSFALWWFYGAALFIVALPMAIIMKPQGQQPQGVEGTLRKCPKCAEFIQPDASICKHCHAEVSPLTNDERKALAKKAKESNYVPGWLTGVVFIAIAVFIWNMAGSGGGTSGKSASSLFSSDFTIKLSGSPGLKYNGSYMVVTAGGDSTSKTVDGSVPDQFNVSGTIVSTQFQKQAESGDLKVEIVKGGSVVAESETSVAYGVVSAATQ
jgi:hypothetical protein